MGCSCKCVAYCVPCYCLAHVPSSEQEQCNINCRLLISAGCNFYWIWNLGSCLLWTEPGAGPPSPCHSAKAPVSEYLMPKAVLPTTPAAAPWCVQTVPESGLTRGNTSLTGALWLSDKERNWLSGFPFHIHTWPIILEGKTAMDVIWEQSYKQSLLSITFSRQRNGQFEIAVHFFVTHFHVIIPIRFCLSRVFFSSD